MEVEIPVQTRNSLLQRINRTCQLRLRAQTINEDSRSVEAIVTTDQPVAVFDSESFRVVDEILVASGGTVPPQLPLLDNHNRFSSNDVIGSVREWKQEDHRWIGRLFFADDGESGESTKIWGKVRDGHITDVSLGYQVISKQTIEAGQSKTISGKDYKAKDRPLRIATKWVAREVSVTPIGADSKAKFRGSYKAMNKRLLAFLKRKGLSGEADSTQAREFITTLRGTDRIIAGILDYDESDDSAQTSADLAIRKLGFDPGDPSNVLPDSEDGNSGQQRTTTRETQHAQQAPPAIDEQAIINRELTRQREIREMGTKYDIPVTEVQNTIDRGLTPDQAGREFLAGVSARRRAGTTTVQPSVSDEITRKENDLVYRAMPQLRPKEKPLERTREQTRGAVSLAMGLMIRNGLDPINNLQSLEARDAFPRKANLPKDFAEACADDAQRYAGMSLIDIAREAAALDGFDLRYVGKASIGASLREYYRATMFSGATLSGIFTTNFSAGMIAAFDAAMDTTRSWTTEGDLPNFQTTDRVRMTKGNPLKPHSRGGSADHTTFGDATESYKLARYSTMFVVDEMDLIDDRFGAIDQFTPQELGEAAAQLRPDLVWSIMYANEVMRDAVALFNTATHANLNTSSALSPATLQTGITKLNTQRENGRNLSTVMGLSLLIPHALFWIADQYTKSSLLLSDSVNRAGDRNPLQNVPIELTPDARLDNGVTDPRDGTTSYAGSATTWYLARRGGRHTIEVGYLTGSGRRPSIRSFVLDRGEWGVGWDINLDIGAKALAWEGMQKNTA